MSFNKKFAVFIILQTFILIGGLGVFLHFRFYRPMHEDQYLFPEGHSQQVVTRQFGLDIRELNPDYIVQQDGLLDDRFGHRSIVNREHGLTGKEVAEKMREGENVYLVDVREVEEYEAGHIEGSVHIRGMDLTLDKMKKAFNLNQNEFKDGLFVLICHDGGRGLLYTSGVGRKNIKYLIKGIEYGDVEDIPLKMTGPIVADFKLFGKKYQKKYQTKAEEAIRMITSGEDVLIIDVRPKNLYKRRHIKNSVWIKIGRMSTPEYEEALRKVLDNKGSHLIALPMRYSELFYANLLFLRLEKKYGFDDSKFHIVFHQFDEFVKSPDIKIIGKSL